MADRSNAELNQLAGEARRIYGERFKDLPPGDQAAILFDLQQEWFDRLENCESETYDKTLGGIRMRGFCTDQQMQEAWNRDWRSKNPDWGPATPGVNVSSDPPQVFFRLKKDANGQLVVPQHILMHEIEHTMDNGDMRLQPVHERIRNENYRQDKPKALWGKMF